MNCSDVSADEMLEPKDGALVVATEFICRQLADIPRVMPNDVKVKWIAELAELFTSFAGKD